MIFKEEGRISEVSCMIMEHVPELKRANDEINFLSSKNYCLEATNVVGEKCSSLQTSWLDNEVLQLKTANLSLFDSQSSASSSDQTEDEEMVLEFQTYTKSIAPGADDLMLAPKIKKLKNSRVHLQKRRDFGIDYEINVEADAVKDFNEEKQLFSSVFNSVFEMIILIQLEEISAEAMAADSDISEDCNTPSSLRPSIAVTCPPAPKKRRMTFESPPAPKRQRTTFERQSNRSTCRQLFSD